MDVNELREKRKELENKLTKQVATIISEFREETGFSPHAVLVEMMEVSEINSDERTHIVERVNVLIDV